MAAIRQATLPALTEGLDPAQVISALLGFGLLDTSDIVTRGVLAYGGAGRHARVTVEVDGTPAFFVKVPASWQPELVDAIDHEAGLYARVQADSQLGAVRALMPGLLRFEAGEAWLVLEVVEPALPAFAGQYGGTEAVAAAMGRCLAVLHGTTAAGGHGLDELPGSLPALLQLPATAGYLVDDQTPGEIEVVRRLATAHGALGAIGELGDGWEAVALIHGDVRPENWFLRGAGADPGEPELGLLDWEMADLGDPAWDVAAVLHEPIAAAVLGATDGMRREPATAAMARLETWRPAVELFWSEYCDGIALTPGASVPPAERCMGLAAAWMVQTAIELAARDGAMKPAVGLLVDAAVDLLRRPVDAARQLGLG